MCYCTCDWLLDNPQKNSGGLCQHLNCLELGIVELMVTSTQHHSLEPDPMDKKTMPWFWSHAHLVRPNFSQGEFRRKQRKGVVHAERARGSGYGHTAWGQGILLAAL